MISQQLQKSSSQLTPAQAISYKFHQQLRTKHIEKHKAQIRRERQSTSNLNQLLETMPHELSEVLQWCMSVDLQSKSSKSFNFMGIHVVELFKIVQRFPCLETVTLLLQIINKIPSKVIDQLFQFDIMSLLIKLLTSPERIVPRPLIKTSDGILCQQMRLEIVKVSMHIIVSLCKDNETARNFIVASHKGYFYVNKIYEKYQKQVQTEYILCLHSFVKKKFAYSQQMVKTIRKICTIFCFKFDSLSFTQILLIIQSLSFIIKSKQTFAIDLIEDLTQYDIFQKILIIMQHCTMSISKVKVIEHISPQEIGQLVHQLNNYLLHYIEISTNQHFNKLKLLQEWFIILKIESSFYQEARRCVYFQFSNYLIEEQNEFRNDPKIKQFFMEECVSAFSRNIQTETNENNLHELSNAIWTIFVMRNVDQFAQIIMEKNLVRNCLEAITRDFYSVNISSAKILIEGIIGFLDKICYKSIRERCSIDIQCYQKKLQSLCHIYPELGFYSDEIICRSFNNIN